MCVLEGTAAGTLIRKFLSFSGRVDSMRKFIMMNTLAVVKITKKHDKQSSRQLQWEMVRRKTRRAFVMNASPAYGRQGWRGTYWCRRCSGKGLGGAAATAAMRSTQGANKLTVAVARGAGLNGAQAPLLQIATLRLAHHRHRGDSSPSPDPHFPANSGGSGQGPRVGERSGVGRKGRWSGSDWQ